MNKPPTYRLLSRLAYEKDLTPAAFERALILTGYIPDLRQWQKLLHYLLLALGAAFTVSGIFFFFAYNWADMPSWAKFGLIEAALLVAVVLVQGLGLEQLAGKVALFVAAMLVGVLFAVFGQVYQTGADAYTLFLNWAILIVGWAAISNLPLLWLAWLILLNLAWGFYWSQVLGDSTWTLSLFSSSLVWLNGSALIAWESNFYYKNLSSRWANRLIAAGIMLVATMLMEMFIFSDYDYDRFLYLAPFIYIGVILLFGGGYTFLIHDLFMLTLALFSILVVNTSFVANLLEFDCLTSFPISLAIIIQAALAVMILRLVQTYWEKQNV